MDLDPNASFDGGYVGTTAEWMEAENTDDEATVESQGPCTRAPVAVDYSAHFSGVVRAFRAEFCKLFGNDLSRADWNGVQQRLLGARTRPCSPS